METTILLLAVMSVLLCVAQTVGAQTEYTKYVNPFIGTATAGNGHTFPNACLPFSLIQAGPVTGSAGWKYCSGYVYDDSRLYGFSQTRLDGTGCPDLGDVMVMPVTARAARNDYLSNFRKETEKAHPGYYGVVLDETGVKAEMTATPHVAYHRYTYLKADSASLLVDLQNHPNYFPQAPVSGCEVNWDDANTISGHYRTDIWVRRDVYFVMSFSRPMQKIINLPLQEKERGNKMLISFNIQPGEVLEVKIALSSSSIEGAKKNLMKELSGWDFDKTVRAANQIWNSYLSRIDVQGTDEQKTNFYTCFYHALIQPNNIADVDGQYRNAKNEIQPAETAEFYSTFSLWDTYRAAHPFYTIIVPEKVDPFVRSLVSQGEVQGFLPIWTLWGKENYCMIANHAVPVVAEAYHKGFRGFDVKKAYAMVKQTQTVSHQTKSNWEMYQKYGYYPYDLIKKESVSLTLETVYDDYAAGDMAQLLNKKDDAKFFKDRSRYYKNLFDSSTKFMRPRSSNGTWLSSFNPSFLSWENGYTEGNSWQYTWHVQHDIPSLIKLMGGPKSFVVKLDSLFALNAPENVSLHDVSGLIGMYAHGNEPSHHVAYLYALAGCPYKTQKIVREIIDTQYRAKPDGLCGNDDCGQMSAWYMFSSMGFYPVNPVSGQYVFGAPQMPRFVLHLQNGKTFVVKADNLSKENKYVDRIYLNGKIYKKRYINHTDIMRGGELIFKMKSL